MTSKPRVFSGVQPSGKLHIGNYIGALSVWAKEQDTFDGLFCVVDLHALTVPEAINPSVLNQKIWETVAIYLASGLDPKKSSIFVQSTVHEHAELAWILTCVTPLGWLERMTQFKTKASARETVGSGLLCYPALMAADILLYDTKLVPVGEDQRQHIELTRDVAIRFNNMFGPVFSLPEAMIRKVGARIMGLDDPNAKMSKSIGEIKVGHSIGVIDPPNVIAKAIKSAVTDSGSTIDTDNAAGGVRTLLTIYQAVSNASDDEMHARFNGKGYGFLKSQVIEAVCEGLRPVREETQRLMADKTYLKSVIDQGSEIASGIAEEKMALVRNALGIDFIKKLSK
ncbi:MAG: tryptophan--tRNA ligase [Alphaproteobacteria bacterium]|nr:tryptophan--tRNA ligase [Alphaproteobacteria bacterium]